MARWIVHADADAFFASVEARDAPWLRGRAFAVAAEVVMCASYEGRGRGVRAGMTVRQALRRCPDLALVPPHPEGYQRASDAFFAVLRRYADAVEPGSMEEAFLAVSTGDPSAVGRQLRQAARDEVGIPVSVGIGRTKLIAKLASRRAKPDGLVLIDRRRQRRREHPAAGSAPGRLRVAHDQPSHANRSTIHTVFRTMVATAVGRMAREGRPARRAEVFVRYDDGSTVARGGALPLMTLDAGSIESTAFDLLDGTGFEADGRGVSLVGLTLTLSPSPLPAVQQLLLPQEH